MFSVINDFFWGDFEETPDALYFTGKTWENLGFVHAFPSVRAGLTPKITWRRQPPRDAEKI